MSERTYLELSEDGGGSHKFYEVIIEGTDVTIRYGRIGTDGTKSTKSYASPEAAKKDAQKKIRSKKSKGYEEAVMGVRKKRPITRRSITSTRSSSKKAPVLWKFNSGSGAFGIYVDDESCWIGNQAGKVFQLNQKGEVQQQFQLPDGVKCIVADEDWLYVGCDDGNVYDLTGKLPRLAYSISEDVDIFWLDINNGLLGVSDRAGTIAAINYEDEEQWSKKSSGSSGWMVRVDEAGRMFHGHSNGVTCYYGWEGGQQLWESKTGSSVLFGWREGDQVYAGTAKGANGVEQFDLEGKKVMNYKSDGAVYSCAASEDGEYVFAGDSSSSVYCWNNKGERLWKLATTSGSAYSMQYHNEKIYIVTTTGAMVCIDASPDAIEKAKAGEVPEHVDIKAPSGTVAVAQTDVLETTSDTSTGVILHCVKVGGKLRVRVLSDGYHNDWNVQFPRNLRKEGAKYRVDEVRETAQGGFYRSYGDILAVEE